MKEAYLTWESLFADASKSGVAQEAMQNAVRKAGKAINEQEARQILGVTEQTSWEEILQVKPRMMMIFFIYFDTLNRVSKRSESIYMNAEIRQTVWE